MSISVANAVKKYLRPTMESKGYSYVGSTDGGWDFVKHGSKEQHIFVQRCRLQTLRLELRVTPSFRHKHLSFDSYDLSKYPLYDDAHRCWCFRTQTDVDQIVKCFAHILVDYGFDLLEQAVADPLDLVPTPQMHVQLFSEHERLTKEFLSSNSLLIEDYSVLMNVLAQKMLEYQKKFTAPLNLDELLLFAAAYGLVFERLGAEWLFYNNQCVLEIQIGNTKNRYRIYPLTNLFHFLHHANQSNALRILEMDLQNIIARLRR